MIDTTEAGAGSYPQAPENEYKGYRFKIIALCELEGCVYAENQEKAEELIANNYAEERYLDNVKEVEEIIEIEEEK